MRVYSVRDRFGEVVLRGAGVDDHLRCGLVDGDGGPRDSETVDGDGVEGVGASDLHRAIRGGGLEDLERRGGEIVGVFDGGEAAEGELATAGAETMFTSDSIGRRNPARAAAESGRMFSAET